MKNLLNQFIKLCDNEEFQRRMVAYERVLKTKQWEFVRDVLLTVKGTMLSDMLSHRFTILDQTEKDVTQRTYHNINEVLEFLSSPAKWIRRKSIYEQFSTNLAKRISRSNR